MRDSSATSRSLIVVFFTQRHPQTNTNITDRNDGLTDGTKSRSRWDLGVFKGFISSALQALSLTATQRRTFHEGKLPPKIYLYRKIWPKKNMVDMTTDVKLPWMLTCLILTFSCCIGQSFSVTQTVLHWNIGSRLKSKFACCNLYPDYSNSFILSNASALFLSRISSLERERNLSCRLFTSSIKREIRHFPVVLVQ